MNNEYDQELENKKTLEDLLIESNEDIKEIKPSIPKYIEMKHKQMNQLFYNKYPNLKPNWIKE